MKKRLIGVLLACVMVLAVFPLIAGAADGNLTIQIAEDATVTNTAGSTVKVDISITDNPGIVSTTIPVAWDGDVFKLTGVENVHDTIKTGWIGYDQYDEITDLYYIAWNNDTIHDGNYGEKSYGDDGRLCTLVFELKTDVEDGAEYPIEVVQEGDDAAILNIMSWHMDDFMEKQGVTVMLNDGKVVAIDGIPGDVDSGGVLDTEDAVYLMYHILFKDTPFASKYPVNASINLDYDGNGTVNTEDAVYLMYHILFKDTPFASKYPLYP